MLLLERLPRTRLTVRVAAANVVGLGNLIFPLFLLPSEVTGIIRAKISPKSEYSDFFRVNLLGR